MAYVTQTYQLVKEEGVRQKAQEDVVDVLDIRFGPPESGIVERVNAIDDTKLLKTLHTQAVVAESIEKFRQFMDELLSQAAQSADQPPSSDA